MRCLLVPLMLTLGLTACGGGSSDDTPPPLQREPLNFTAAYVVQDATGAAQARLAASGVALGPPAAGGIDRIALTPDATRVLMLARDDPASPSALFGVAVATPTVVIA
ncbi:MAG: hypothetical protein KDG57_15070 [Rhodoferax sp.]|nr:hypothetical protein [Rhodoferax sp.]